MAWGPVEMQPGKRRGRSKPGVYQAVPLVVCSSPLVRLSSAKGPLATIARQAPLHWVEMSDVRSGPLPLMTTLHRGHALLHLTR